MNIEIWNLGNYISLRNIDCIVEQRREKSPNGGVFRKTQIEYILCESGGKNNDT